MLTCLAGCDGLGRSGGERADGETLDSDGGAAEVGTEDHAVRTDAQDIFWVGEDELLRHEKTSMQAAS